MRLLCTLIAAAAAPLAAQQRQPADTTRPAALRDLVVTAERRPTTTDATSSAVRVIEASALRAKATPDLPTLLRELPGIQLDPVVGSGNGVSMQGLGSDRIAILVDGAPLVGRLSNELDLTRVAPAQLQRIEIVEGPQSTLYGSSALGGVINLITRAPSARRAGLATQGGSFGQFDVSGRVSSLVGASSFALDLGRRTTSIPPGTALNTPGGIERWDGMARALVPVGRAVVDLRAMHVRENQDYRTGASTASRARSRNHNLQTDALGSVGVGATTFRAHVSAYDHTLSKTNVASGTRTDDPQSQRVADLEVVQSRAIGRHALVLGVRGEHEWIESARISGGERKHTSGAAYASAEWKVTSSLSLATGARLTVAEQWGSDVAPRVGLVWNGANGLYAKAGVAHGFRAPSFNEQYSDFLNSSAFYAVRGNVDLQPETSWNTTAEVGVSASRGRAWVRGFHNQLRQFIETEMIGQEGSISVFSYRNVGRATTQGAEVGGDLRVGSVRVEAAYAYLDARDADTDGPLLGQAKHNVRGAVTFARRHWSLTAEGVRTAQVPLSQNANTGVTTYQGAAGRVNLRGGLEVANAWHLNAGVDNVGDVVPANAVNGFGRRWFAGLSWEAGW